VAAVAPFHQVGAVGALWEAEGNHESCKMGSSKPQFVFTDQATVAC